MKVNRVNVLIKKPDNSCQWQVYNVFHDGSIETALNDMFFTVFYIWLDYQVIA